MTDNGLPQKTGSCRCGIARFSILGRPLFRAYCHCLICQEFNESDYADITVFYRKDVSLEDENSVAFRVYQQPPLLKRGTCKSCGKPAIERLTIPLMPSMAVVPSYNIHEKGFLPKPELHNFYHRRKHDIVDNLPKHTGFVSSQLYFGLAAGKAMLSGRARYV